MSSHLVKSTDLSINVKSDEAQNMTLMAVAVKLS